MPGLLQHRASFDSDPTGSSRSQPVTGAGLPENAAIWLPSKIPTNFRSQVCYDGLAAIEEKIRTANCYDSLDAVRHVLNIKSRLVHFKNKSARGQCEGNRSRTIIDQVHERARVAAERYRAARHGKLALAGTGEWEKVLRILEDGDIRAYQDVEKLRTRVGHPGTLEDGQLVAVEVDTAEEEMDVGAEDSDTASVNLMQEKRDKRDGTGETRRALSWIWTSGSRSADPDDDGDNILQSEWAKSRARVGRCREEVLLLKEEMRRVVAFLEWKRTYGGWIDRTRGVELAVRLTKSCRRDWLHMLKDRLISRRAFTNIFARSGGCHWWVTVMLWMMTITDQMKTMKVMQRMTVKEVAPRVRVLMRKRMFMRKRMRKRMTFEEGDKR